MTMESRKMRRTLLASAALVTASLAVPAPAQTSPTYDPWCVEYFRNYCASRWQVENFASFSACWETYKNAACQYEYL